MSNKKAVSVAAFRALKNKNFRCFWFGQCISLTGTWMQRTAQVWLVYSMTKSPFLVGILGVCQFMPMLLFSLFAGVVADRFPKKRILLVTQSFFMLQSITMTFLTYTGQIRYWHVLILSTFFGITQTIDMPSRHSFFFELVGKDDIINAVSLNSTIANLAKVVGPAVSGAVMVAFGPAICFFSNAMSYMAVIGGILLIHVESHAIHESAGSPVLQKVKEGLLYIKKSEVLVINIMVMGAVCTFAMNNDIVIPVFSSVVLKSDAAGYTILMAAAGAGSFFGAIFMALASKFGLHKNYLIISAVVTAVLQILTILTRQYITCMLLLIVIGFANMVFLNTANSIFQINSPDEYRGRVMSVYSFLNQGSTPIGNFYAGTVMEQIGGKFGFLCCGAITLLLLLPVFVRKRKTIARWLSVTDEVH